MEREQKNIEARRRRARLTAAVLFGAALVIFVVFLLSRLQGGQ